MPRAVIVGCGFVGEAVTRLLQDAGWEVIGVTRSGESSSRFSTWKLPVISCDISDNEMVRVRLDGMGPVDALVDCVNSGPGGVESYRKNFLQGAQNLLKAVRPLKFLFTSSTSVYAQNDGSWVTEQSAAEPERETGRILLETEEVVLAHGGIVTRLAGIYGPGRWALLRKFLDGTAIIEDGGSRWVNQIHRDDAAGAIAFLLNNNGAPGIYNVSDSTPLAQLDCYKILAGHFQKPLPPPGNIDLNRKRGVSNKRVSNAKLRALGWLPQFPSMRDALAKSE